MVVEWLTMLAHDLEVLSLIPAASKLYSLELANLKLLDERAEKD